MKIEQALVLYLLRNKELSLQGIGTFTIDVPVPEVIDNDKPVVIPPGGVSFHYDPKTGEDNNIVEFIVENTKKIKPLASADLDSFLTLGRQFLNIGKPFTIQNLGTLEKLTSGELAFRPGQLILQKVQAPKDITENDVEENDTEDFFNEYQKEAPRKGGKKVFVIIAVLLIIGLGAWTAWSFLFKESGHTTTTSQEIIPLPDTPLSDIDSATANASQVDTAAISQKAVNDSVSFAFIVKETTNSQAALARMNTLKTYRRNIIVYTKDSITYKVAEPFFLPLADTLRIKDSLKKYYRLLNPKIEIR
ncbi:MAG: hypothetical protein ABIO82_06120 [Ginsengibacter sp.]